QNQPSRRGTTMASSPHYFGINECVWTAEPRWRAGRPNTCLRLFNKPRSINVAKAPKQSPVNVYFSDFFRVAPEVIAAYGAINVSLLNDLPLFIDPFLLFNSSKPEYRLLHSELLKYLRFLRDKAAAGGLTEGLLLAWLTFPEVRQTWIGFSLR